MTLSRERFEAGWERLLTAGYDERFRRAWGYYLSYCQAGFETGLIQDYHIVLHRPFADHAAR